MKTAKQLFLEKPESKSFLQTVTQPEVQMALDYALLSMMEQLPMQGVTRGETDNFLAAANNYRLEGARRFIKTLKELPIQLPPPKPTPTRDNLEP